MFLAYFLPKTFEKNSLVVLNNTSLFEIPLLLLADGIRMACVSNSCLYISSDCSLPRWCTVSRSDHVNANSMLVFVFHPRIVFTISFVPTHSIVGSRVGPTCQIRSIWICYEKDSVQKYTTVQIVQWPQIPTF